jgi:hypothetical protein
MRAPFILIFILYVLLMITPTATKVVAQENNSSSYVPLISITSVPEPLVLPQGREPVTYHYVVKNLLSESALSDVYITDTACSSITFETGDDDGDERLDYGETWQYACTTELINTTTSTATVTGTAFGTTATHNANATVVVGSDNPAPLVSIVNLTKIEYPLSLPLEGGEIIFTYRVSNPGVVPLQSVVVTDDNCGALSGKIGDTNGNNLLDTTEVWLYTCATTLYQTTINTVDVTAFANGMQASGNDTTTIKVDNSDNMVLTKFPDLGSTSNTKMEVWAYLVTVLVVLLLILVVSKKIMVRKTIRR